MADTRPRVSIAASHLLVAYLTPVSRGAAANSRGQASQPSLLNGQED